MSFTSRFKQAVKDYGTTAKVQLKTVKLMAKGASIDEIKTNAKPLQEIFVDRQRCNDVKKLGLAVSAAVWSTVIAVVVD
jgi:post-segregation antitoxin (ccd killing protein)